MVTGSTKQAEIFRLSFRVELCSGFISGGFPVKQKKLPIFTFFE